MRVDPNPYLAAVMRAVRSERPPLPEDQPFFTRVERVPAGNYVEIWFRTGGCTWDRVGGCTMCNYGAGTDATTDEIVAAVSRALDELDEPVHELMISPSGGMWDHREVPSDSLSKIYELAIARRPSKFFVETRAETVAEERVREMRHAFGDIALAVELGMESANDAVLAHCVNKGSTTETFRDAATVLHRYGVELYANVSLGTALLDRRTAAWDALASTRWAFANGADTVVLFPLHIKPFTLLHDLFQHDLYERVALWDLVEILCELGPDACSHTEIAWYKSYYDKADKIALAPGGCEKCIDGLISGLDRYRATQQHDDALALDASRCECAGPRLLDAANLPSDEDVATRVLESYAALATILDLVPLWKRHRSTIEKRVRAAFQGYGESLQREVDRVG